MIRVITGELSRRDLRILEGRYEFISNLPIFVAGVRGHLAGVGFWNEEYAKARFFLLEDGLWVIGGCRVLPDVRETLLGTTVARDGNVSTISLDRHRRVGHYGSRAGSRDLCASLSRTQLEQRGDGKG